MRVIDWTRTLSANSMTTERLALQGDIQYRSSSDKSKATACFPSTLLETILAPNAALA
jgi:hypothetical protein